MALAIAASLAGMTLTASSPPSTGVAPLWEDVIVTTFAALFISNTASTLPTRSTTAAVPGSPLASASAATCAIIWVTSAWVRCWPFSLQRPSHPPSLAVSSVLCCWVGDPAVGASVESPPPADPPPQAASVAVSVVTTVNLANRIIALILLGPHSTNNMYRCTELLIDATSDRIVLAVWDQALVSSLGRRER